MKDKREIPVRLEWYSIFCGFTTILAAFVGTSLGVLIRQRPDLLFFGIPLWCWFLVFVFFSVYYYFLLKQNAYRDERGFYVIRNCKRLLAIAAIFAVILVVLLLILAFA